MDKEFLFAEDGTLRHGPVSRPEPATCGADPWRILVVDDDPEVHTVTRYALRTVTFRDRPLDLISAYSAAEALRILRDTADIALVLLDVVMETDDAGLRLVRCIREDLGNSAVRLILRTGQPGQAPEDRVILDYDINDYRAKTELTAQKLFTTVIAALRGYADIMAIEDNRRGLRRIIEAADGLPEGASLPDFAQHALSQLHQLLEQRRCHVICALVLTGGLVPSFGILASSGRFAQQHPDGGPLLDTAVRDALAEARVLGRPRLGTDTATLPIPVPGGQDLFVHLEAQPGLTATDRDLLAMFAAKMSASFGNVVLHGRLRRANAELRSITQTLEARVAARTRELMEANAKLEQLASLDSLTGILNRRRFIELAGAERDRCQRYGRSFSVLLIDLDHFKTINDSFGHAAGDSAICEAAQRTASALRSTDSLARYGGEELVVLLPETRLAAAERVAERIRQRIAGSPITHEAVSFVLTASIGVAEWNGLGETLAGLLDRADQALYCAKQQGRNQIMVAAPAAA